MKTREERSTIPGAEVESQRDGIGIEGAIVKTSWAAKLPFHYGWIIVVVTFLALLSTAGVRNAAAVFIKPFEAEFGWDRGSISLAIAVSLFAFGFGGPLGGGLIDRFGPRRVLIGGMALIALGLGPLLWLNSLWQLHILWGIIVGIGTGATANVLGASVASRWFQAHRGVILGLFSAASAAGQLAFLPAMITLASAAGWRWAIGLLLIGIGVLIIPVLLFMRDRPQDVGLLPVGAEKLSVQAAAVTQAEDSRSTKIGDAIRTREFWILASSFFICGYTTNGLIGTHLLPHAVEHGFSEVTTAGAIGLMGIMNIFGTLASGWLSDRYDNRKLLAFYYGFRALSLLALPFILEASWLFLFAIVYGLDWIATVPPTVNLTAQRFGRASLGTIFGWIFCAHMIGAGVAAYAGGLFRTYLGDYHVVFISAAVTGFIAAGLSMSLKPPKRKLTPTAANA